MIIDQHMIDSLYELVKASPGLPTKDETFVFFCFSKQPDLICCAFYA